MIEQERDQFGDISRLIQIDQDPLPVFDDRQSFVEGVTCCESIPSLEMDGDPYILVAFESDLDLGGKTLIPDAVESPQERLVGYGDFSKFLFHACFFTLP